MSKVRHSREIKVGRREFLAGVGVAAAASGLSAAGVYAGHAPKDLGAESVVKELYSTLSESQRQKICLPVDSKLRRRISPNWNITEPTLGDDFYTKPQRELAARVIRSLCSTDGFSRLQRQMEEDSGGLDDYSIAMFGEPGSGQFQWELTGRHVTLRADGDRRDRLAFGGPIVYGHGEESDPKQNLFYYQTKQVNKVFAALDGSQRKRALVSKTPRETAVQIQGKRGRFLGLPVKDMSDDQKALVVDSLRVLLTPFRHEDIEEAMWILIHGGGIDSLYMAFSNQKRHDLNNDQEWDVWRVEGPNVVWHFRGAPHVHAYINIGPGPIVAGTKKG